MNTISSQNPFFETYSTLHGTVPFDKIKTGDYVPAVREGIRRQNAEIDAIIRNPEVPTFANTVLAYEKSGEMLHRVGTVFGNLLSAETNDDLQELAKEIMPMMSEHENNISLNEELFARIKAVYEQQDKETLNPEQHKLLEDIYNGFVRNGANLQGEAKEKYRALCKELSLLTLQFSENNLKETNDYKLVITDKSQLAGLPESAVEAAAETAGEKGVEGWVFTLQAPSYGPFLTYADSRDLRRELYMAYNTKCTHDNASNNLEIVKKLANVRMEIAQLLGYDNFAEYNLQERMAQNSESVYKLLDQLLEAYTPTAKQEYAEVQALARQAEGEDFVLMPWDWAYYSHKLKDRKFNIDDELLRPYFELNNVKQGVFGLATRLYGITFKKNPDIPVYHKDVDAYEVFDKDGKFLAVFYTDFHPRAGKRSGAWMTSYKEQWIDEKTGENSRPHISIVMNFTKPTQDKPALLTFGEVETFLHEFGHSLHGMFANSTYGSLSGTNVYWDFVELPSQFMENFAIEKEFLHTFARHYQTGELIPDELVQRIVDSSNFNAAYACLRQVSFGLLDMAWYTRNTPFEGDVKAYDDENGEYQGYDIYFANRLAEDLGVKVNYVSTEAANRIEYLQTGKVDVILANFTVTPERAEEVDFALPYMNVALGVVSPDSNVITSLDSWNADDQMIVISGTTAETYLTQNYPDIPLKKYDSYATAKSAMENGGVAWANDNTEVIAFASQNPGYTVGIPSLGSQDTIAPAVSKGNETLLNAINDEIKALGKENFFHADYEATLVDTYGTDYEDSLVVEGGETSAQ